MRQEGARLQLLAEKLALGLGWHVLCLLQSPDMIPAEIPSVAALVRTISFKRVALRAAFFALLAYHLGLLIGHVWDGRFFDLATSLRWLSGALLFSGILALRRVGVPIFWGRKAVVLWSLVVLLHAHAGLSSVPSPVDAPAAATLMTFGEVLGGLLTALSLVLLVALVRGAVSERQRRSHKRLFDRRPIAISGFLIVLSPRPPPFSAV
jgi:hypothetical protein